MTAGSRIPTKFVNPSPTSEGAVLEAENRRRDYLLTGDSRDLTQFLVNLDRIPTDHQKIIELTADNPDQQPRIAELKNLTDQSLSIWAATAEAARAAQQSGGQIPPLAREIELRSCLRRIDRSDGQDECQRR